MVTPTGRHLRSIADRFRPEEAVECMASWNEEPLVALTRSWLFSAESAVCIDGDDLPLCIWGINDEVYPDDWREFWMLGTVDILTHKIAFLRTCRAWLRSIRQQYPRLRAHIDPRYELSLKWARWLGCEILAPAPHGVNGAPFCEVRLWAAQ